MLSLCSKVCFAMKPSYYFLILFSGKYKIACLIYERYCSQYGHISEKVIHKS